MYSSTPVREDRSVHGILAQLAERCNDAYRGRWFESTGCLIRCVILLLLYIATATRSLPVGRHKLFDILEK